MEKEREREREREKSQQTNRKGGGAHVPTRYRGIPPIEIDPLYNYDRPNHKIPHIP